MAQTLNVGAFWFFPLINHRNESRTIGKVPSIWLGVLFLGFCAVTTLSLVSFPDFFVSAVAVRVLEVGASLLLVLCVVSASSALGDDQSTISFKLALVLWAFLLTSQEVFDRSGGDDPSKHFSSAVYGEISLWVVCAVILGVLFFRNAHSLLSRQLKWLYVFAAFCMLSSLYSPQPKYSGAWSLKLILVMGVLGACGRLIRDLQDLASFIEITFWVFSGLMLYGALAGLSTWSVEGRLGESPTSLAVEAGIVLVLSFLLRSFNHSAWPIIFTVGSLLIMISSAGKAGIVGGVLSAIFFLLLKKKLASAVALLTLFVGLGVLLLVLIAPLKDYAHTYVEENQADNLSGRTDLWAAAWPLIRQSPLLGHGYMASKSISTEIEGVGWEAGHLHNAFLDVLYNNGIIGLILILCIHYQIVRNLLSIIKCSSPGVPYDMGAALLAIYVNLLINAFFNAIIGSRPDTLFMMFLAIFMVSAKLRDRIHGTSPSRTGEATSLGFVGNSKSDRSILNIREAAQ